MPGFSDQFPWPSYYGNYDYFENRMARHQKVAELTAEGDGVYRLRRTRGDVLRLFICECYAFGVADYIETTGKLGHLDLVIINSARSEEHTSELQSLMRISYAVFCLKKHNNTQHQTYQLQHHKSNE